MVRLIQGDCLEVLPTLGAASVDAVVTDPPYKLSQAYSSSVDADNLLAVSCIWPVAQEMLRVAKPGAACALFYDTRILPLALEAMRRAGWSYLRALTLYRRWGQASLVGGWMSTSDFILVFVKPGAKPGFHGEARHDVYVKALPEKDGAKHPAKKPIDAVAHIVSNICPPGGTVLDPFMGSGTTGVACLQTGRDFIGVEKDAAYFAVAEKRLREAATLFAEAP